MEYSLAGFGLMIAIAEPSWQVKWEQET